MSVSSEVVFFTMAICSGKTATGFITRVSFPHSLAVSTGTDPGIDPDKEASPISFIDPKGSRWARERMGDFALSLLLSDPLFSP